ncbi:RecQ-mediated genome instability protein 1 [Nibea albiflora]|uniref:RecQ-mediated genome instability protein 1 n=1 Tax=Nibea albiflora TaxID=240163 RepID=A0ACB7FCT2_NIBAL|nr:RecQ-mediated genome instability protein 1 [Nibea albiflora]
MAPEIHAVVHATQAWLQSSQHIQVPFAWLEACVEWLQEEAGGAGRLSQQQVNQQALDQWLLTDLRDLDYPVLPEGLAQAQKTELSGTFCVQVDSLLDISQPAYGQLQKLRGTDCENDEVSAVTQATQRPWETRPTRMLLLQLTDGVQSLEAMEYKSIPALSAALRPGVKLQLQGQIVCRLGMLLLGPTNVKVLGGEVEDLVDRNNQGRVLCRTLGLPEEQQQEGEEAPPAPQQGNEEMENLELDDADLLASLEAQEEMERVPTGPSLDSGYGTLSEPSTLSSRSSSIRNLVSTASSRSEASARSNRSGVTQSDRGGSAQGHRYGNEQEDSDLLDPFPSDHLTEPEIPDHNMADDEFPDEDFDDLPLDELDDVIFQDRANVPDSSHRSAPQNNNRIAGNPNRATKPHTLNGSGSWLGSSNSRPVEPSHESELVNDESDFMDDDMDCFIAEVQSERTGGAHQLRVQPGPSRDRESTINKTDTSGSSGRLTKLSDEVLTGLLGFSVAEKGALKRDPARRGELDAGMKRCQEELVDMCCVMTIEVEAMGRKAVVTKAQPVDEKVLQELEQRAEIKETEKGEEEIEENAAQGKKRSQGYTYIV